MDLSRPKRSALTKLGLTARLGRCQLAPVRWRPDESVSGLAGGKERSAHSRERSHVPSSALLVLLPQARACADSLTALQIPEEPLP